MIYLMITVSKSILVIRVKQFKLPIQSAMKSAHSAEEHKVCPAQYGSHRPHSHIDIYIRICLTDY